MEIDDLFPRPEDDPDLTPERRIFIAAINCISESGLEGTTVRAIAAKAGLNPAAVNYYYRSKDHLIEEALQGAWAHVAVDIDSILRGSDDARAAAVTAAQYLVEGSWRYSSLIRAIMVEHPKLRLAAAAYFKKLFEDFAAKCGSSADPSLATALLLSFAGMIGYGKDAVGMLTGLDLSKPAARMKLAESLTDILLPAAR